MGTETLAIMAIGSAALGTFTSIAQANASQDAANQQAEQARKLAAQERAEDDAQAARFRESEIAAANKEAALATESILETEAQIEEDAVRASSERVRQANQELGNLRAASENLSTAVATGLVVQTGYNIGSDLNSIQIQRVRDMKLERARRGVVNTNQFNRITAADSRYSSDTLSSFQRTRSTSLAADQLQHNAAIRASSKRTNAAIGFVDSSLKIGADYRKDQGISKG